MSQSHLGGEWSEPHSDRLFSDGSSIALGSVIYLRWQTTSVKMSNLVLAKTRVAPKKGTYVSRMEIQSFIQCLRMLRLTVCTSHLAMQQVRIVGYSQCTVALKPYYQNCVSEAHEIMQEIQEIPGREVEVMLTPGPENPADLITRVAGTAADASSHTWQHGPSYFSEDPDSWPHHVLKHNSGTITDTEIRHQHSTNHEQAKISKLLIYANNILDNQRDLPTCIKQFAWILQASCLRDREKIKSTVSSCEYSAAQDHLLRLSQEGVAK